MISNARVLVTGGLGFVGRHLVNKLNKLGNTVVVIERPSPSKSLPIEWQGIVQIVWADIACFNEFERILPTIDVVYHLAGVSGAEKSIVDPMESLNSNCQGTLNLLEGCRQYNPKIKLIYPSTRLVYGKPSMLPVDEHQMVSPRSFYAIHKLTVENYIKLYSELYGIQATIIRISNPYGPSYNTNSNYGIINWFITQAFLDKPIKLYGSGTQIRDYIFISDLIDILLLLGKFDKPSELIYNVGSGSGISMVDMVCIILDNVGKGQIEFVPWSMLSRFVETGDYISDISLVSQDLNWVPKYTISQGLELTIKYLTKAVSPLPICNEPLRASI